MKVELIDIDIPTLREWFFLKPDNNWIFETETKDGKPKVIGVWEAGCLCEVRLENISEEEVEKMVIYNAPDD